MLPFPRTLGSLAVVCSVLVIAADFLFYRAPLGWNAAIAIWLVGTLVGARAGFSGISNRRSLVASTVLLLLSLALLYNPFWLPLLLCAAGLALLSLASRLGWEGAPDLWVHRLLRFGCLGWTQIWRDSSKLRNVRQTRPTGKRSHVVAGFLQRWSVPVLVTTVFLLIFTRANPIIDSAVSGWFGHIGNALENLRLPPAQRILLWSVTFVLAWALFRYRGRDADTGDQLQSSRFRPDTGKIVRSLLLLNLLFAVMNILDLRYLWGAGTLPDGMTYAEYAHRGAYPLVVSALLAGVFVLVCFRPDGPARHSRIARGLVGFWIFQNILLTLSAAWRLNLYVEVYSLTRLRVAAAIWMALVILGLFWICIRILADRDNRWLVRRNLWTVGIVLFVASFMNFDGGIARYNIRHCEEAGGEGAPLDLGYLRKLGFEALPALRELRSRFPLDPGFRREVARTEAVLADRLRESMRDWRGWSLLRARIARANREETARTNDAQ